MEKPIAIESGGIVFKFNYMIADVIKKGQYYQVLDQKNKKIKEVSASIIGELLDFNSEYIICRKGNYYVTYDETFKKIKEVSAAIVGEFRNTTGEVMTFLKSNYIVTYDVNFKKISERRK